MTNLSCSNRNSILSFQKQRRRDWRGPSASTSAKLRSDNCPLPVQASLSFLGLSVVLEPVQRLGAMGILAAAFFLTKNMIVGLLVLKLVHHFRSGWIRSRVKIVLTECAAPSMDLGVFWWKERDTFWSWTNSFIWDIKFSSIFLSSTCVPSLKFSGFGSREEAPSQHNAVALSLVRRRKFWLWSFRVWLKPEDVARQRKTNKRKLRTKSECNFMSVEARGLLGPSMLGSDIRKRMGCKRRGLLEFKDWNWLFNLSLHLRFRRMCPVEPRRGWYVLDAGKLFVEFCNFSLHSSLG